MTTGERIKEMRLKKGMSQAELGEAIGVKKAAIHKYETGVVVNLKRSSILKLAEALDVTPAYLLCIDDIKKPAPDNECEPDSLDNKIIEGFRHLSPERKKLLLAQIEAWLSVE